MNIFEGLFAIEDLTKKRDRIAPIMPPIPFTGWQKARDLPDLSRAQLISVDVETKDEALENDLGPGWARGEGHICGVSIGADDDGRWYFPVRHTIEPWDNHNPEQVFAWLGDQLGRPTQPKFGANLTYDLGWLKQEGVTVRGELYDVQFAEALLDETALVALEELSQKYLGIGKETTTLYQWLGDYYCSEPGPTQRKNIYRSPPRLVGPYAIGDIDRPLRIMPLQYELLRRRGLLSLFHLECRLIPLMIEMRFAGVPVDVKKAQEVREVLLREETKATAALSAKAGFEINVNAADSLKKLFDKEGLEYPLTEKTKAPSFTKDFLNALKHPIGKEIREIRSLQKTRSTFIESYILEANKNGKIFPQFHQLKDDGNGTVTGRFSSSNPNFQNLPARDGRLGPLCRGIIVPDCGHRQWRKFDLSQIQYRLLAHFAIGDGADELRRAYNEKPDTDYHDKVQSMVLEKTGIKVDRKPIKNINFGLLFGMGKEHLAETNSWEKKFADSVFDAYHRGAPYVKSTMGHYSKEAELFGVVKTVLGRETHFNLWEPREWGTGLVALPYERALMTYGQIRRAGTHKALCNVLQGSEGDWMKAAMLQCYVDGVFDKVGFPRITVHDELDFSDPGDCEEGFEHVRHVMETVLPLRVPVLAGSEVGPNWGACH